MATLVLQGVGMALGGAIGGPLGAMAGRALGGLAGAVIDQSLLATATPQREGPRLSDLNGVTSTEGAPIPRVYGRARIGGQVIWATPFEEEAKTDQDGRVGGKGGTSGGSVSYSYFASVAIALCEGPIALVRRVWADGKEIDLLSLDMRVHRGTPDQMPDPLLQAYLGGLNTPAYRGTAYVVIERMALGPFGNRLPQLTFEVVRPMTALAEKLRAIDLIPGASEYAYAPGLVQSQPEPGNWRAENRHQLMRASDLAASLDSLQAICPHLTSVALVVSWFGDDLRCGTCSVAPRVENHEKNVPLMPWSVAGLTRAEARIVSHVEGRPAYGGTPDDESVRQSIADLRARGLSVVFYPFVMMDVPPGNDLPHPHDPSSMQPPFPWRGRITCDPAPGVAGSPDATATAGTQAEAFFGSPVPGASEWSYRRFILHYARLCAEAGGVDAFLIGSELVGLTRVRSAPGVYPAADQLAALAADVRAILGPATKISYAADWTEYGAHVLEGGSEVRFPLDVLWSSPAIDFIGIDAYWPLTDWREGDDHADANLAASIYDRSYLRSRLNAGEAYDWFYPDAAARATQTRSPITDGAYGKPWMFRQKDLAGWWSNGHVERTGGVEIAATNYVPRGKPVWLTEIGCPAVDRGSNAPNVFPDRLSVEGGLPYFSTGRRDDLIQIATLESIIDHFDPGSPHFSDANNPLSPVYGGRMVDVARIHAWAWDARPFPAFPAVADVWSDSRNWPGGHWIAGRIEGVPLDRLIEAIVEDFSTAPDIAVDAALSLMIDGYVIDRRMSVRDALEPLALLGGVSMRLARGTLVCRDRDTPVALPAEDLVEAKDGSPWQRERRTAGESAGQIVLSFTDAEGDYRKAAAASRRLEDAVAIKAQAEVAAVMRRGVASALAEGWLRRVSGARETLRFSLGPRAIAFEAGDVISFSGETWRIGTIVDGDARRIEASRLSREAEPWAPEPPLLVLPPPPVAGPPLVHALELAVAPGVSGGLVHLAVHADPWPGRLGVWRQTPSGGFDRIAVIDNPASMGATLNPLGAGPLHRWDAANILEVQMRRGSLSSASPEDVLGGANRAAICGTDGRWEIIAFTQAQLTGARTWRLSGLLRGLGGEDELARREVGAGCPFVVLDGRIAALPLTLADIGRPAALRTGPLQTGWAGTATTPSAIAIEGRALRPLSPVHLRARRTVEGILVSFVRRSRIDADAWDLLDVPLGEEVLRFEASILREGELLRRLEIGSTQFVYPAGDEAADFGAPQSALELRILQISATVGAGYARHATVPVET